MANNIINAVFGSGICAVTTSAYRANYGVKLRFSGIDLPTAFECDFSNYDTSNKDSVTAIGQNGEVQIPDQLWDSGLNIYAYVYLHPTDDSGVTVYTVTIPVLGRPNRTEETPTPHEQSVIEQAISALNDAVEQTAADVETTTANAQAAAQSEANASVSERSAAASASAALASQNAAESAAQGATESASGAAESARNAANSAAQAAQSATDAQEYAEQAEQSAQSISGDVERAEQAAATATEKATEAASSVSTASGKANEASASATAAAQSASSASVSAQNAASSSTAAESSATDAEQAKTDAQDAKEAAEAAQAAAEAARDDAEAAADRAEQAEQEVLSSMDGTYENLTSGNAQQLLSTVTEANSVPYLFRPTAANADRAYLDAVVGGTVAWNQLQTFAVGTDQSAGVTYTLNSDGSVSCSGTSAGNSFVNLGATLTGLLNHVLYICGCPKGGSSATYYFRDGYNGNASDRDIGNGKIIKGRSNYVGQIAIWEGTDATGLVFKPQLFDLTQMFGSTIADYIYNLETASAGAGVAFFRKLFPKDYYEYNAGELLSVNTSQHKMVGFNAYDNSTGKAKVVGGNQYEITGAYTSLSLDGETITPVSGKFTPSVSGELTVTGGGSNTCIHLVWDGERDDTYEPYTEWVYPLDSSLTLRGIPKLDASGNLYYDGDTYAADGTVTRKYGVVDLGTLTWKKSAGEFRSSALAKIPRKPTFQASSASSWSRCAEYAILPSSSSGGGVGVHQGYTGISINTDGRIWGRNDDFTNTTDSQYKSLMSGVYLVYELATPTTETATPYRHLQICDPNGTEEFVSTGIVPVGHNTRYPENLRAKIEGLPWNFNSIIAMTETTTTASKAYSVGDYFILNNVLYRVISAIASGGTITIGTNCRATTIMDEIKALS